MSRSIGHCFVLEMTIMTYGLGQGGYYRSAASDVNVNLSQWIHWSGRLSVTH